MEDKNINIELDTTNYLEDIPTTKQDITSSKDSKDTKIKLNKTKTKTIPSFSYKEKALSIDEEIPYTCLKNERIIIRHINKAKGLVSDPKHVLFGGMAKDAIRYYSVPVLKSGQLKNVLTNKEMSYLEDILGLEEGALSIYNVKNNFWKNKFVRLEKEDNYLDLNNPMNYIDYKILLANNNFIAPSLEELENHNKATYEFVIIKEKDQLQRNKLNMTTTMKCYKEFGAFQNDHMKLRCVVELLTGRIVSNKTNIEFLQTQVNDLIQSNPKLFLEIVGDPYLDTKIIIKKALEKGIIRKRGDYYYNYNGTPLCEDGQDPTLSVASKYLLNPKYQEILVDIENRIK